MAGASPSFYPLAWSYLARIRGCLGFHQIEGVGCSYAFDGAVLKQDGRELPVDVPDRGAVEPPREINLCGYRLHPMDSAEVIARIALAVGQGTRLIMANLNLHGMATMYDNPAMARLHRQADCQVLIDGMPIILLANILLKADLDHTKRTTSLDFYDDLFQLGESRGWKFGYIGGKQWVLEQGIAELHRRFPDLHLEGRNGYFDMNDFSPGSINSEIVEWLGAYSPDVVIVGMGMPRQEEWIEAIQHRVDARVFLPTGAYLDYQVGEQSPAPRWLGRYGLEWAYRLAGSPCRLAYRYLIEPFVLAYRIMIAREPLPGVECGSPDKLKQTKDMP